MLFKNSVRTSKRTPHFTITKINWLMLFKEIIADSVRKIQNPYIKKYSVTGCKYSWNIYNLPLGLKGQMIRLIYGKFNKFYFNCALRRFFRNEQFIVSDVRVILNYEFGLMWLWSNFNVLSQ
jgi:hypothetical protein